MRLKFWLLVMDALFAVNAPMRLHLWAVRHASDCVDWHDPLCPSGDGEAPF